MCYVLCCLFLFVIQFILYINILHLRSFCIVTETYSRARVWYCVGRRDALRFGATGPLCCINGTFWKFAVRCDIFGHIMCNLMHAPRKDPL